MNHDDHDHEHGEDHVHSDVDPLDHPEVVRHLSEELIGLLRQIDDGEEDARKAALRPIAAIVDAFAATGVLEFAYLAPADADAEDGPIAWLEVGEAIADAERDSVVMAGSEILEVFDGPITLVDPPENAAD